MKLSDLKTSEQVVAEDLRDPEFRREWERTTLARAVALRVLTYRTEHGLSQRALAKKLDMTQPQLARLEAGEHNPTIDTLARLAHTLDIEFAIDIHPRQRNPRLLSETAQRKNTIASYQTDSAAVLLVATKTVPGGEDPVDAVCGILNLDASTDEAIRAMRGDDPEPEGLPT